MSVAFSSPSDRITKNEEAFDDSAEYDVGGEDEIDEVFEVERCCRWIRERDLDRVALQFPDSLLKFAPEVAKRLESELGFSVYVLGDTSYGECCVDEVAVEHLGGENYGLIHFGHSCLTPTQRLPTLYVFTRLRISDPDDLKSKLSDFRDSKVAVFYDVQYHWFFERNSGDFETENVRLCPPIPPSPTEAKCGRKFPFIETELNEVTIVYVGSLANYRVLLALTFNGCKDFLIYDQKSKTLKKGCEGISKLLMKRYYLIEKAKDAERIGILIGTLGVSRYRNIISDLRERIKKSGKKVYSFIVGKPNVAKLANFPEIDVFVLVACPESSIFDSKDYLKPVITPFELDVALNETRKWTGGDFKTNFRDLLEGESSYIPFTPSEKADMSLISGKIRSSATLMERQKEWAVVPTADSTVSILHTGGGGEFLSSRSWQGLDQKLGETPVESKPIKGQTGLPTEYRDAE